ncbi:MAG TPA: hypothetical protein VJ547_04380 [Candidatus Thermoplasmatota archaeon]|nr:hypothetical protein [Candidatus Thermoplasmatota archaeon]
MSKRGEFAGSGRGRKSLSAKRPARRYIGLIYAPASATRREVTRAIEEAWSRKGPKGPAPAPRLLVCEGGRAIVAVPRELAASARLATDAPPPAAGGLSLSPVVTSGTVAAVKARLGLRSPRPRPR